MKEYKERGLLSLISARRTEAFWEAQRARITAAGTRKPSRAWLLAPVAAVAAALLIFITQPMQVRQAPAGPAVTTAFLEHLDLLDDMDVLEAAGEDEL